MIKLILLGIIGLFCFGTQAITATECTTPEVIAGSLSLLESIAVLCGFAGFGTGAILIRKIITGGQILAAVMQSLDENKDINNLHLVSTAGNQGNIKAAKQFMELVGDGSGKGNA